MDTQESVGVWIRTEERSEEHDGEETSLCVCLQVSCADSDDKR